MVVMSACGAAKSPTAPSSTTPPAAGGSTAVISGSVRSGSPLLAASTGSAMSGLTVTVAGTTISSGVDASDHFTLVGVPPGDVDLRFHGAGVDSTVRLSLVLPSQTVALVVNVAGAAVLVDSEVRSTATSEQLEGRVESLPPTTTAGSLVVAGRTVKAEVTTRVEQGGATKSFADLQIGMRVHVEGVASGSDLRASLIRIQNTTTWIPVEINGTIDSLSGTAALFEFKIGSRLVKGDTLTTFFGSAAQSFSTLKNGVRVEVKGQQRDGYVYAERLHVNDSDATDDDDDGRQEESASIAGALTAMAGTKPALTLTVAGTTVRTSSTTEVRRRGDVQSLDALKVGQTLHVVGVRQANGSLDARKIQIDDDQTGGEFEIEGSVGGLKGTCPAVTFGVNGFSITANAATVFEGSACSALKSGSKVTVKGTKQADGSVVATRIKT
jgi:Domain of unknown function (DUF5666)